MIVPTHLLTILQQKEIDVWLAIQAAFADAIAKRTDLYIHRDQLLYALNQKHTAMVLEGYIRQNDTRYMITEEELNAVAEVHRIYYEYMSSVFLYNPQLLNDLIGKEYQIHLYNTVLLLEY